MIEIDELEQFDRAATAESLENAIIQDLDLSERTHELSSLPVGNAIFLGCSIEKEAILRLHDAGAILFPRLPNLPYDPYRPKLYRIDELYDGFDPADPESYARSFDARIYAHCRRTGGAHAASILETLAQRLHDHAITDAMEEVLVERKV